VSDTDVHNGQHAVGQQGGDQRGEGAPLAGGSPFLGKPFCDMGQAEPLQLKGSHMDHSSLGNLQQVRLSPCEEGRAHCFRRRPEGHEESGVYRN
jgi:hypothetical protein